MVGRQSSDSIMLVGGQWVSRSEAPRGRGKAQKQIHITELCVGEDLEASCTSESEAENKRTG